MNITQNIELIEAKTRLTNAKAEQAEIKLKVMKGEFVPLKDVEAKQAEEVSRVRTKLLAIPAKLARRLSGQVFGVYEVDAILSDAIIEALNELSVPQ